MASCALPWPSICATPPLRLHNTRKRHGPRRDRRYAPQPQSAQHPSAPRAPPSPHLAPLNHDVLFASTSPAVYSVNVHDRMNQTATAPSSPARLASPNSRHRTATTNTIDAATALPARRGLVAMDDLHDLACQMLARLSNARALPMANGCRRRRHKVVAAATVGLENVLIEGLVSSLATRQGSRSRPPTHQPGTEAPAVTPRSRHRRQHAPSAKRRTSTSHAVECVSALSASRAKASRAASTTPPPGR